MKGTVDQWNQKYKFVSDGTWFKQGTQAKLICWYCNQPDIDTPIQELQKLQNVAGIFSGIRVCEYQYQLKIWSMGYERQDEQGCGLDQFQITYRVPNLDGMSEDFQIPGHSPRDIQNLPGWQEDDYDLKQNLKDFQFAKSYYETPVLYKCTCQQCNGMFSKLV